METFIQDRISFENEFERVRPMLFKRALRRVRDRDAAADVVQAVAMRAWPNRERIHACGMLRYWLRCVDLIAHTASHQPKEVSLDEPTRRGESRAEELEAPSQIWADGELGVDLQRALASIRPAEKALVLLAAEGYSVAEIAERMHAEPNNVRIALHRARVALRVKLAA